MPETGKRNDPFLAFRFEVRITGLAVGGFSECSGLQLETEIQDYVVKAVRHVPQIRIRKSEI